jgi:hypothetical protein
MTRDPPTTTKVPPDALRLLRLIAAHTGERQYEILGRLVDTEGKRLSLRTPSPRAGPAKAARKPKAAE